MTDKPLEEMEEGSIFNDEIRDKKRRGNFNTNMGEHIAQRAMSASPVIRPDKSGLASFDLKEEIERKWKEKLKRQQEKRKQSVNDEKK